MFAYHDLKNQQDASVNGRYFPYENTELDPRGGYYDFKAHPELIETSLEDFLPYAHFAGVQRFYDLLRWANGPGVCIETTDCRLIPVGPNRTPHLGRGATHQMLSRLVIIYRDHRLNTEEPYLYRLSDTVATNLNLAAGNWEMGAVGYAFWPAHFTSIAPTPQEGSIGFELSLRSWVWGNGEAECFASFDRLVQILQDALARSTIDLCQPLSE